MSNPVFLRLRDIDNGIMKTISNDSDQLRANNESQICINIIEINFSIFIEACKGHDCTDSSREEEERLLVPLSTFKTIFPDMLIIYSTMEGEIKKILLHFKFKYYLLITSYTLLALLLVQLKFFFLNSPLIEEGYRLHNIPYNHWQ